MGAQLLFLAGSCHVPPTSKERFETCDSTARVQCALASALVNPQSVCVSQNVHDTRNENLSEAPQSLKLDHDFLGHVGFQRL